MNLSSCSSWLSISQIYLILLFGRTFHFMLVTKLFHWSLSISTIVVKTKLCCPLNVTYVPTSKYYCPLLWKEPSTLGAQACICYTFKKHSEKSHYRFIKIRGQFQEAIKQGDILGSCPNTVLVKSHFKLMCSWKVL